jgi:lipopolysaccharide transport system permease protein
MFRAIWSYRNFIYGMVKRDFQGRYKRSLLGGIWAVIEPLSMIAVYTVIFSNIMRPTLAGSDSPWAYSIYLCAGIFTWQYFGDVISHSQTMFIQHAGLMKKNNFPRSTLPVIVLLNSTINFAIVFALLLLFMLLVCQPIHINLLAFIPLLMIQQGIAVGLGLILGTLNVFFRDIGKAMGVILLFWFWLTPIVYSADILGDKIKHLVYTWNPMASLIHAYQTILLTGELPVWRDFISQAILATLLLLGGFFVFMKLSGEMVDEL